MTGVICQFSGRGEMRRGRPPVPEVDVHGRPEEGEPAAENQQAPVLVEGLAGIEETPDVADVLAGAGQQLRRRGDGVGDGEVVGGRLEPVEGLGADVR